MAKLKHGLSKHPLRIVWAGMVARCHNPSNQSFSRYGALGIEVCDSWRDSDGLRNFIAWAMAAGYRPGLQIDRTDNAGGYGPDNCRFVSAKENSRNRGNSIVAQSGRLLIEEWEASRSPVSYDTVRRRVERGWPLEDALSTPKTNKWWHSEVRT